MMGMTDSCKTILMTTFYYTRYYKHGRLCVHCLNVWYPPFRSIGVHWYVVNQFILPQWRHMSRKILEYGYFLRTPIRTCTVMDEFWTSFNKSSFEYIFVIYSIASKRHIPKALALSADDLFEGYVKRIMSASFSATMSLVAYASTKSLAASQQGVPVPCFSGLLDLDRSTMQTLTFAEVGRFIKMWQT